MLVLSLIFRQLAVGLVDAPLLERAKPRCHWSESCDQSNQIVATKPFKLLGCADGADPFHQGADTGQAM